MSATSTPGSAPKSMSSRLLTMKFMQRAANSPSSASPPSLDEPPLKRRRTDSASTPSKINVDALADRKAVQAALASEEAKRQAALEKQAAEAGDTRWVLSFEDQQHSAPSPILALRVVQTGFANLDSSASQPRLSDEELEDEPVVVGRRSFGRFNKALEKQQDPSLEESSESDDDDDDENSDSSESNDDSDDPTTALIKASRQEAADRAKAERKAKKRAAKAEAEELAKKRRKDVVNLNGLTNLSGKQDRKQPVPPGVTCYSCGGPHYKKDCPTNKRGYSGNDDGPPRKSMKSK